MVSGSSALSRLTFGADRCTLHGLWGGSGPMLAPWNVSVVASGCVFRGGVAVLRVESAASVCFVNATNCTVDGPVMTLALSSAPAMWPVLLTVHLAGNRLGARRWHPAGAGR